MHQHMQFPSICARCASAKSSEMWKVYGTPTVISRPAAWTVRAPYVNAPVCWRCLWKLRGFILLSWVLGFCGGVTAGLIVCLSFCNLPFGEESDRGVSGLILGMTTLVIVGSDLTNLIQNFIAAIGCYYPDHWTIEFKNQEFQEQFDELNS